MHVFSSVDIEGLLIGLVGDSISYLRAEHQLVTSHVVVHYVLQGWHESILVYKIKVNNLIRSNLDSNVSFDVIDKPSDLNCVKQLPAFYTSHFINNLLKEVNVSRTSDDQAFTSKHYHLSQVFLDDCFHGIFRWVFWIYVEDLTLSVERVDHISLDTVERLVRELLNVAIQHMARHFSNDLS